MQISAAIGSITNYKSRITIPDVLFDRNYITSALLTSRPAVPVTVALDLDRLKYVSPPGRRVENVRETVAGAL